MSFREALRRAVRRMTDPARFGEVLTYWPKDGSGPREVQAVVTRGGGLEFGGDVVAHDTVVVTLLMGPAPGIPAPPKLGERLDLRWDIGGPIVQARFGEVLSQDDASVTVVVNR